MARTKQSRGNCIFCGRQMTGSGLAKHFASCAKRKDAVSNADHKLGTEQTIFHLHIQYAWCKDFWLHLEMSASETLEELDSYLRDIWLECCGHLSKFATTHWGPDAEEIGMRKKAGSVFKPGIELLHIYDFGTSSETKIKVISARQGKALTEHPIYLMARNDPPEEQCCKCDKPAAWLYVDSAKGPFFFCDTHAKKSPHYDYDMLPFLNSPRSGVCGYDGPAEPPY